MRSHWDYALNVAQSAQCSYQYQDFKEIVCSGGEKKPKQNKKHISLEKVADGDAMDKCKVLLQQRFYCNKGHNLLCHMDLYDKLKPYTLYKWLYCGF